VTRVGASKPGGERVSIKKDAAGRKRSQATHEGIRVADYSPVFRVAENNRSSSTGQTGLRSGTSVGANYREAYRARSRAEFTAKCGDSLRELEETSYWLELLVDAKIVPADKLSIVRQECDELIAIFVTILKSSKDS
jgi:four helix bundle protein